MDRYLAAFLVITGRCGHLIDSPDLVPQFDAKYMQFSSLVRDKGMDKDNDASISWYRQTCKYCGIYWKQY